MTKVTPVLDRFWAKVDKTRDNGCWNWTGCVSTTGYGQLNINHRATNAHRFIYEHEHGPIPAKMLVDHICHNRACVNTAHMRLVTRKQNAENMAGPTSASQSGTRGVWFHRRMGRWVVQVQHHGRRYSGGTHPTRELAEAAAIALRSKLFTHNDLDRYTIDEAIEASHGHDVQRSM